MWTYDRQLEYPVNIKNPNPAMAKVIMSQLGGPYGKGGSFSGPFAQKGCPFPRGILLDTSTTPMLY